MNNSRTWSLFGLSALALALGAAGCGGGGGSAGSGGTSGGSGGAASGGTSGGSGGAVGSGGHVGSGGSSSSGGAVGSGGHVGSGGSSSSGGTVGSGGRSSSGGTVGSGGGTSSGGAVGSGGGTSSGGAGGASSGSGGAAGGGGASAGWTCPAASTFTGSPLSGSTVAATRVMGAPPADSFNNMANDFTNVEGPVWIGDALYFSEMTSANLPPARILKLTADDVVSVFIDSSGSNGLAVDGAGNIVSANHGAQGIVRFSLPDKTPTTLVSMYNGKKFNSPNDLTVASDGTIYFTDPDYQNNARPQGTTNVYQVKNGTATLITDYTMEPNGISLSLDEQTLLVGGHQGLRKYAITNGTVAMTGTPFGPSDVTASGVNTDGMTLDCAGNVYVAVAGTTNVVVVGADGSKVGTITISGAQAATNVAFGGTDHQTLYITGQGSGKGQGVFKVHLNIPGLPY